MSAGTDCVQSCIDDVASLRCGQCNFHRGTVSNFPDENCFWRLTQCRPQSVREIRKVLSQFALIQEGLLMGMNELNGILECDNVNWLRSIQLIDHCGESRRLAAAGCAGDEDDAVFFFHDLMEDGRQTDARESWNFGLEPAHHDRVASSLTENIDAKTSDVGQRIIAIAGTQFAQITEQSVIVCD